MYETCKFCNDSDCGVGGMGCLCSRQEHNDNYKPKMLPTPQNQPDYFRDYNQRVADNAPHLLIQEISGDYNTGKRYLLCTICKCSNYSQASKRWQYDYSDDWQWFIDTHTKCAQLKLQKEADEAKLATENATKERLREYLDAVILSYEEALEKEPSDYNLPAMSDLIRSIKLTKRLIK